MPEAAEVVAKIVEAAAEEVEVVVPTTTTTTKVKIIVKIEAKDKIIHPSLTKKVRNIRTYLPVLGGPVLSTGRKDAVLLTVATR